MMDKNEFIEKAKEFTETGDCYLHYEAKNGEATRMMAGSGTALMMAITDVLESITDKSDSDFETTIKVIQDMHRFNVIFKEPNNKPKGGKRWQ